MDLSISSFFTRQELDQLARDAQFVQREGKINGNVFFDLIVFHSKSLKAQSLNDLSIALKDNYRIEITKQSLHERFNKYALAFLKMALEKLLTKQLRRKAVIPEEFKWFKRILIKDSTCFQIDESLAQDYPGSGGGGSGASVRIQFEYDILSGTITDLSVNAFNVQDATDSLATIELTQQGDLILRDLAYMGLQVLKSLDVKKRFYLCRVNPITRILEEKNYEFKDIDFVQIATYMKKNSIQCLEKQVYLGGTEKFKTRLVIYLMPEEQVAERIRKAQQNNKKKGRKPLSKEYKARAALNLFVTNTNAQQIPVQKAWSFYRLRWQVELIFKIFKSICHLEKVKKVNKHRIECYIYSKLLLIVLGWRILWKTARALFLEEKKVLSFFKASKTLFLNKINDLRNAILNGKSYIEAFLNQFYDLSRSNHLLEKKQNRPIAMDLLFNCLNVEYLGENQWRKTP